MIRELSDLRQVQDEPPRRWFADDYFDLIVWGGDRGAIVGFQLCYDKSGDEHALTWHINTGFSHQRVDDGEMKRPYKATPILVEDGFFDVAAISRLLKEHSRTMDEKIARFVLDKISSYQPELNSRKT